MKMACLIPITNINLNYPNKTKNQGILLVNLQINKIPTIVGQQTKELRL